MWDGSGTCRMRYADCHGESAGRSGDIGHKRRGGICRYAVPDIFPCTAYTYHGVPADICHSGRALHNGTAVSFAKRNGKLIPIYFLLGGIGLASLFSSFMLIMAANMDNSSYQLVARWLAGNIWGTSWHQVLALLPYMLILVPFLLTKSNILDILLLGENTAISLGIAVERELRLLLIASVALTSACVAVSGGIGFVGLVAPHMARRLIGGRHHALMPASMLLGALLLLLADTLGRSAFQPRDIPVGIVISVLSAPYFLFLLRRYF